MAKLRIHTWYRQYQQLKAQAADAVLFYRFGDFYETFDDDAKLIAELLDVTLTRKDYAVDESNPRKPEKLFAPMAGMPYHAVERYVSELVARGYRVAIAEQISETESSRSDTRPKSVYAAGVTQSAAQRGGVHREIVRLITPGTVIDAALLNPTSNNYLAAVLVQADRIGLAYADLSTGEFAATEFRGERAPLQLQSELARLQPAEVLVPDDQSLRVVGLEPAEARLSSDLAPMTKDERDALLPHERVARRLDRESAARWAKGHVTAVPAWRWELRHTTDELLQQLGVRSLAGFGLADRPLAVRAAGALVQYVAETQRRRAAQLTHLRAYTTGSFMFLDPQTRRNLELLESQSGAKGKTALIGVLDRTKTPMGARLLRQWIAQPLTALPPLQRRQAAVAAAVDESFARAELRAALADVGDLERALNRVGQGPGVALPRDLVQLRAALRALPAIVDGASLLLPAMLAPEDAAAPAAADDDDADDLFAEEPRPAAAPPAAPALDLCPEALRLLESSLDDDPPALLGASNYLRSDEGEDRPRRVIRPGFEPRIDQLVSASRHAQEFIDRLEGRERERTGIKTLRVGYNNVFGYFIELSRNTDERLIPKDYERKQTLVNAERYITAELKTYEELINRAKLQLGDLEREAFARICHELEPFLARLRTTAQAVARIDALAALAEAAERGRYVRPVLAEHEKLLIRGGRHPIVEQFLDEPFVPNDLALDTDEEQLLIITGPNMAGKSTVLRQVALIVLLAQIGAFVPAESAEIGLVDRIFTRIGAQDDIATGQSTFMVEMTETAALLVQSTRRSLIILDEVGRGTSTYDGMAIARAVIEYIHNEPRLRCRTLFATHYHELTALTELLPRLRNYHMAAVEQGGHVVFLHELRPGGADRSYGIHVAELAGIPAVVIKRAAELLAELEGQTPRRLPAPVAVPEPPAPSVAAPSGQLSLFDSAPSPVIEYLRRLNLNELTPLEALTRLYELQQLAREG